MTKQQLLEKHWEINLYDGWWEPVVDQFKTDMAAIGIEVDNVYFSGFWSQGDGACFEGYVQDWDKFLASVGYTDAPLVDHAFNHWYFSCKHRGSYYDEYCTVFDYSFPMPDSRTDDEDFIEFYSPYEDELKSRAWFAVISQYVDYNFAEDFKEVFRDHMRELYSRLEKEYEYLTSEEAVWEAIVANGLDVEELEEEEITLEAIE